MNQYRVRDAKGQVFGPADLDSLTFWVRSGRMTRDMDLLNEFGQVVMKAGDLPELANLWPPPGHTFCPNCTAPVSETARYCPHCGWSSAPPPPTQRGASGVLGALVGTVIAGVAVMSVLFIIGAVILVVGVAQVCSRM